MLIRICLTCECAAGALTEVCMCLYVRPVQRHHEARGDADGPPEEDHDQCPADEGAGPQQECAFGARITATSAVFFLLKSTNPGFYKV